MAKKFAELEAKMSPASRSRSDALYEKLVAEMPLHELRQAKALSQVKLAKALHINQAAVSKMENRADMYISTLRDYIRAMGGDLEIVARFPDGAVRIQNFAEHGVRHKGATKIAKARPSSLPAKRSERKTA